MQTGVVSRQKQLAEYQKWLTPAAKRERAEAASLSDQPRLRTIIQFWPLVLIAFGVICLVL
jgi:hypothetical protein